MKIRTYYNMPIIDVNNEGNGIVRDRYPDNGWGEMRGINLLNDSVLGKIKILDLNNEIKVILLEDLAYYYGNNTSKFNEKLKEFGFIKHDVITNELIF